MARDTDAKCRRCRRATEKLFLKGDRCATSKCAVVRRAYAPGAHGKTGGKQKNKSEYGNQLATKQKIKRIYGVLERQFRKHFDEVKNKPGVVGDLFLGRLEKRIDNVVYRIGFASSRAQARQLVNHGLIKLNGKKMTIPSAEVKVGDLISINKQEKTYFKNLNQALKNKKDFPSWINFDSENMEGKITNEPNKNDLRMDVDAQVVVEYYSR